MKKSFFAICAAIMFIGTISLVAIQANAVNPMYRGIVNKWEYKPATEEEDGYFIFWPIFVQDMVSHKIFTKKSGEQQFTIVSEDGWTGLTWIIKRPHLIWCQLIG